MHNPVSLGRNLAPRDCGILPAKLRGNPARRFTNYGKIVENRSFADLIRQKPLVVRLGNDRADAGRCFDHVIE
jgi:hypothetical protein